MKEKVILHEDKPCNTKQLLNFPLKKVKMYIAYVNSASCSHYTYKGKTESPSGQKYEFWSQTPKAYHLQL